MVGTLKPHLMEKKLFELFALIGGGGAKTLGASTRTISHPSHLVRFPLPDFFS